MSDLGNKKIMAKNLDYYMRLRDKSRNDLVRDLGFKYTTVADWLNAKTYPRIDRIEILANYFGVEKADLVEDKSKNNNIIPVLGYVAAGTPIQAVEEILGYEEIPEKLANTGELFGLRIKGHSMEPRICEGDTVIVKKQNHIKSGELAIVCINGDEGTCKKVMINADGITLISYNPSFPDVFYSAKEVNSLPIRICGKVVKLIATFS